MAGIRGSGWSTRFHEGDRVEWIGPAVPDDREIPDPGELGTVIAIDPPDTWVVSWDRVGTAVYPERHLRKVGRAEGETWGLQNFALGFELGLPSEWYLQQYIKKLRPRFSGAFASNVPDPL